jgi:hypothetical protein
MIAIDADSGVRNQAGGSLLEQRGSIYLQDQAPSICWLKAGDRDTDFGNSEMGKSIGETDSRLCQLSCNIGVPLSHEPLDNS